MRIHGIHSVRMALLAGSGQRLTVGEGKLNARQRALVDLANELGCPVQTSDAISSEQGAQGVSLEVGTAKVQSEADLERTLDDEASDLLLILDGVTDPRNFGACIRSAATFGAGGIVVPKDNSAPLNEAAIKTASGGASLVPTFQVVNLARTIKALKQHGFWMVGLVPDEPAPLTDVDLGGKVALVLGAEGTGLRRRTREHCDFLAGIPMPAAELTLNVAVAAGICLYEASRQRGSLTDVSEVG